jgi:dsDNA-specific endonuclease/ATPase MutS2
MELFLNNLQKNEIGYNYVMEQLNIASSYGQSLLDKINIYDNVDLLMDEFNNIEQMQGLLLDNARLFKEVEVIMARFKNIDKIVMNIDLIVLDEIEIFEIKKFAFNCNKLKSLFEKIDHYSYLDLPDLDELYNYLDLDNSRTQFFHLYDEYDDRLKEIRKQLNLNKDDEIFKAQLSNIEIEVKTSISSYIAKYQDRLIKSIKQIAYLDLLIAKANLANKYDLHKPRYGNKIELINAYNPMVKDIVEKKGFSYTKLNIDIDKDITLITGSNMSGKSVSLKSILLNVLLFQYGFYPFAQDASLPLLNYILYVSDELQDVQNSLSSFGMEVYTLNEAIKIINEKENGLIILDEYARGTNPGEAKLIVKGLINYLQTKNVYAVLSTHLDLKLNIDFVHYQVKGLEEYKNDFLDGQNIAEVMDYSLRKVTNEKAIPHDALKVMNLLKMDTNLKNYIENEYRKEEENV